MSLRQRTGRRHGVRVSSIECTEWGVYALVRSPFHTTALFQRCRGVFTAFGLMQSCSNIIGVELLGCSWWEVVQLSHLV